MKLKIWNTTVSNRRWIRSYRIFAAGLCFIIALAAAPAGGNTPAVMLFIAGLYFVDKAVTGD